MHPLDEEAFVFVTRLVNGAGGAQETDPGMQSATGGSDASIL
jgi:hypothetical protein